MSPYVEECRREWKRLGVPDLLAEEMAGDLEADLAEAEADGVSAAEMLGESDPRRFAATWARERGLVSEAAPKKRRRRIWPWIVVGVFLLVLLPTWLALQTVGSGHATNHPVRVTPPRRATVPNVIGMKACKAVRLVLQAGVDAVRLPGHTHGYKCELVVVEQVPAPGHAIRHHGHPTRVTLRLGRR
ncbi:MAG TPA: hypothetical protein VE985_05930 [Gaiellaceae bacterium]|nr:hypothetical protein [Gaiellaceae bacterium]